MQTGNPNPPRGKTEAVATGTAVFQPYIDAVNKGDVAEQNKAMMAIWEHIAERRAEVQEDTSPWLRAMKKAHECEAAFDWAGAAAAYQQAVQVAGEEVTLQSKAWSELSALYGLLDSDELVLPAAQAATQAIRSASIPSMLSMNLQAEARLYLKAKELERARNAIAEAFSVIEPGPMSNLPRAFALVVSAECYL